MQLVHDKEMQAAVYRNLHVLMEETDKDKFESLLARTVQQLHLNGSTEEFGQYLKNNYVDRKHEWVHSYRQKSTINTNMYVEAFYHVLKYIYLQRKTNRRVDKCVHTLLKTTRDKSFEQLINVSKGKSTRKHAEIQKRHKTSLNMDTQNISDVEDRTWNVTSEDGQRLYTVTEVNS